MGNKIETYLDSTKFQQDANDKYVRCLFKPGMPLQTRELNELITSLNYADKMIVGERYKHNPIVSGCEFSYTYVAGFQNTISVAPGIIYWNGYFVKFTDTINLTPAANFVTTGDVLGFVITQQSAGVPGAIDPDGLSVVEEDDLLGDSANNYTNAGAEGADRLKLNIGLSLQSAYAPDEFTSFLPVQEIIISAAPPAGEYATIDNGYYVYENIKYKFFESNNNVGETRLISGGKIKTLPSDDVANTVYITIDKTTAIINGKYVETVNEFYQKVLVDRVKTTIGTGRIDNIYLKNDGTLLVVQGFESVYDMTVQPDILTDNVLYLGYVKHRYYGEAGYTSWVYINQTDMTVSDPDTNAENISLIIKESFKDFSKITDSDNSGISYSDYSVDVSNGTASRSVDRGSLTASNVVTPLTTSVDDNGDWYSLVGDTPIYIDTEKITGTTPLTGFGKFKHSSGIVDILPLVDYMCGPTIDITTTDENSENIVNINSDYVTYTGGNKSNLSFQSTCREIDLALTISELRYFDAGVEQDLWVKAFFNSTEMLIGGTDKKKLTPKGELTTTITIPADMPTGTNTITIVAYTDENCTDIHTKISKEYNAGINALLTASNEPISNYTRTSNRYHYTESIGQSFVLAKDTMLTGLDFHVFNDGGKLYPIKVQVREVVNGIPSHKFLGECTIPVGSINLSTISIEGVYTLNTTTATFDDHVYIPAGTEFLITFSSEDDGYSFGIAALGESDIVSTDFISSVPHSVGALYTSANNLTWNKNNDRFLTCKLNYFTSYLDSGTATIKYTNTTDNSRFMFMVDDIIPNGTRIEYAYSYDDATYIPFKKGTEINGNALNASVYVKATLYSNSDNTLTPMVSKHNNFITSVYNAGVISLPTTRVGYAASTYEKAYGLTTTYQTGINIYNDVVCEVEVYIPNGNCDIVPVFFYDGTVDDDTNLVINEFVLSPELPEALNKGVLYKSTLSDGWEKRTYYFNIDYNTTASDMYMPKDTSDTFRGKILFKSPANGSSAPIIRNLNWKLLRSYNTLTNDGTVRANSVKAYGAVGDGITDDSDAINAAIAAIKGQPNKGELYWEAGDYLWTDNLVDFWSISHTGPGKLVHSVGGEEFYPSGTTSLNTTNTIYCDKSSAVTNCGLAATHAIGVEADGDVIIPILKTLGSHTQNGTCRVSFAVGTYHIKRSTDNSPAFYSGNLPEFENLLEFVGASEAIPEWADTTPYSFGDFVLTKAGDGDVEQLFQCIAPGTSDTKPVTMGAGPLSQSDLGVADDIDTIVLDGTVIWRYIGGWKKWIQGEAVVLNDLRWYGSNVYRSDTVGTTGAVAPTGTTTASDGTVTWVYVGKKVSVPTTQPATKFSGELNAQEMITGEDIQIGDVRFAIGAGPSFLVNVYRSRTVGTTGAGRPDGAGIVTVDGIAWGYLGTYDSKIATTWFRIENAPKLYLNNISTMNYKDTGIYITGSNIRQLYKYTSLNDYSSVYIQNNGETYIYSSIFNTCAASAIYGDSHGVITLGSVSDPLLPVHIVNCNYGVYLTRKTVCAIGYGVIDACRNYGASLFDSSRLLGSNTHFLRNYIAINCKDSSEFNNTVGAECSFYLMTNWTNVKKIELDSYSRLNNSDYAYSHSFGRGELLYIRDTYAKYYHNGGPLFSNGDDVVVWTNDGSTGLSSAGSKIIPPSWLLTPNQSIKLRVIGYVGGDLGVLAESGFINVLFDGKPLIDIGGEGHEFLKDGANPTDTMFELEALIVPIHEDIDDSGVFVLNSCNSYVTVRSYRAPYNSVYVSHISPSNAGDKVIAAIAPEIIDANGNDSSPVLSITCKNSNIADWFKIFLVEVYISG